MISRQAISEFLRRRMQSYLWMKKLKLEDYKEEYKHYRVKPYFKKELWLHQHTMFHIANCVPYFCFFFDMGCVDADTEYLSPTGWKKISEYTDGDVAQYHPETGVAEFVTPTEFVKIPCQYMLKVKTKYGIDQMLSLEHRVLLHSRQNDNKHEIIQASELLKRHNEWLAGVRNKNSRTKIAYGESSIPVTFSTNGGIGIDLSDAELKVQVALIADGHFPKNCSTKRCYVRLKKDRKKQRIRKILSEAGIEWDEVSKDFPTAKGYTVFKFNAPIKVKEFSDWAWNMSKHQLEIVANEVVHWDGSEGSSENRGDRFFSRIKASADFVQYAAIVSGKSARVTQEVRENGDIDYSVHFRNTKRSLQLKSLSSSGEKHSVMRIKKSTDGFKYCFMVPSTFLVLRRNGCVFCTGNTGKTKGLLDIITQVQREKKLKRALVTVNGQMTVGSWSTAIETYSDLHPILVTDTDIEAKWEKLIAPKGDICVIDYPGLHLALSKKVKGKKKNSLVMDTAKVEQLQKIYNFYNGDESHKVKNKDTLRFTLLDKLTEHMDYRYLMTGTPMDKSPEGLWGQFFICDRGETFGDSLEGLFRHSFFTDKPHAWKGVEYVFDMKREKLFYDFMQNRSIRYTEDECHDLPLRHDIVTKLIFTSEQREHYLRAVEGLINAGGKFADIDNAFCKLRQITSGYVSWQDEHGKHLVKLSSNPKLEMLETLLSENDKKFVVFYEYTETGRIITDKLKELSIECTWIWGGTKNKEEAVQKFKLEENNRVLVMQSEVGSTGVDGLQDVSNYMVFYESPCSSITRRQAEKRLHRSGQTRRVFIYDLVLENSIDVRILSFIKEGKDLHETVVNGRNIKQLLC